MCDVQKQHTAIAKTTIPMTNEEDDVTEVTPAAVTTTTCGVDVGVVGIADGV